MDSKYALIGNGVASSSTNGLNGFQVKRKQINGTSQPSPKKLKQTDSKDSGITLNNSSYSNGENKQNKSIFEQRKNLPVYHVRHKLLEEIINRQTIIIMGETGSGKTTQIPQFLHEAGLSEVGMIAVTQPRRVAAITISKRVAQEKDCRLGELVGYTVRFEDVTSKNTKIKYITDGSLLREALSDRLLKAYRVIILDEAHERTINTDVLFGIIKEAQRVRAQNNMIPLKIIIMSATMDVDHFSKYFNNCEVIYLEGRTYPVKVFHIKSQQNDYLHSCLVTLFKIHTDAPANHDVLIFLTGQEEIEAMAYQIRSIAKSNEIKGPTIRVFPLYSQLPQHKQLEVFLPTNFGTRKVILATNIAETSITINGIKYIIDSGVVKKRMFDAITGMDILKIVKISKAQAWQRSGRAGRESEGSCYRAYTVAEYNEMSYNTIPEILCSNIAATVLQLLALGIDCENFDFLDAPPIESIDSAIKLLQSLGAIGSKRPAELTTLGRKMSKFPLDPKLSKMLLSASTYGCLDEMLSLVALLAGENIFVINNEKREQAALVHAKFESKYGDHLTLLNVYKAFTKTDKVKIWCHDNFLNIRNLNYAKEVREQLSEICERCEIPMSTCGSNTDQIRKCLIIGLFNNIAELQRDNNYLTLSTRQKAKIHPSSVLNGKIKSDYILYTELVATGRNYMRLITIIEPEWIEDIVPNCGFINKINTTTSRNNVS